MTPTCRKENDEARAANKPVKYMYRRLYCPEKGMFCSIPEGMVNVTGHYVEVSVACTRVKGKSSSSGLKIGLLIYCSTYCCPCLLSRSLLQSPRIWPCPTMALA